MLYVRGRRVDIISNVVRREGGWPILCCPGGGGVARVEMSVGRGVFQKNCRPPSGTALRREHFFVSPVSSVSKVGRSVELVFVCFLPPK